MLAFHFITSPSGCWRSILSTIAVTANFANTQVRTGSDNDWVLR